MQSTHGVVFEIVIFRTKMGTCAGRLICYFHMSDGRTRKLLRADKEVTEGGCANMKIRAKNCIKSFALLAQLWRDPHMPSRRNSYPRGRLPKVRPQQAFGFRELEGGKLGQYLPILIGRYAKSEGTPACQI